MPKKGAKMIMFGETYEIFCILKQFKWIMYHYETVPLPKDAPKLECYLGYTAVVGKAMIAKILTANGMCCTGPPLGESLTRKGRGLKNNAWKQFISSFYYTPGSHAHHRNL